ncbi:MAG: DUF853 domain-containing protein [Chitinophagales bacterium]|nr:DUF853 domain-containing protein [Chitinophagales bacterium]
MSKENFKQSIEQGYTFKGENIVIGAAMFDKEPLPQTLVKVPLKALSRHGLIAGATGTGKTKKFAGNGRATEPSGYSKFGNGFKRRFKRIGSSRRNQQSNRI